MSQGYLAKISLRNITSSEVLVLLNICMNSDKLLASLSLCFLICAVRTNPDLLCGLDEGTAGKAFISVSDTQAVLSKDYILYQLGFF